MKILAVYADYPQEMNCSNWNVLRPAQAIAKIEGNEVAVMHVDKFASNDDEVKNIASHADLIIVERNFFADVLPTMMYYKVRGVSLMAIFDDAYDIMHPRNVAYPFWKFGEVKYTDDKGKEGRTNMTIPPIDQFVWGVQMVKAVQVPSRYLKEDWSRYNPNTYHIPNYIEAEKYIDIKPLYPHKGIVLGWGGSLSHVPSFISSGILKALRKVVKKYDNVKVMISGDRRVYNEVKLPETKKIYQPFVPEEQFLPLMKTFDIALAPLHGEYDKRRSWIKVLEYMALQIPFVASEFPVYEDLQEYGGLFTNNTADDWEEKLCYMIDNLEEQREIAKGKPFEFAMSQSYQNQIPKTLELYEQIIKTPYVGLTKT